MLKQLGSQTLTVKTDVSWQCLQTHNKEVPTEAGGLGGGQQPAPEENCRPAATAGGGKGPVPQAQGRDAPADRAGRAALRPGPGSL